MKAVILAAGYATRLYPLTLHQPKCLLEVDGRSILNWLCEKLCAVGDLSEIIVVTNAKFFDVLEVWRGSNGFTKPIRILNDGTVSNQTRLGAIGDLDLAIRACHLEAEDLLVLSSDNLFRDGFGLFLEFARSKKDSGALALYDIGDPGKASKKFGVMRLDANARVIEFEEKPEHPKSSFIGTGVYYFPKSSVRHIAEYLKSKHANDAPGHYIRWLMGKIDIYGFLLKGLWYDIGDLAALEEARELFKRGEP